MLWLLIFKAHAASLSDCVATDQILDGGVCVNECPDSYYRDGWMCRNSASGTTTYQDGTFDITLPLLYGTTSSAAVTLGSIVLNSPSSGTISVSIISYFGKVTLASNTGLTFSETFSKASPYTASVIEFSGSKANVNTALAGVTYTPLTYYSTSTIKNYVDPVAFTFSDGSVYTKIITYKAILGTAVDPRNCELNMKVNNKVCNGHGFCDPLASTAACTCYYPYYGTMCTSLRCVQGCMETGTSSCTTAGVCSCNSGYSGTHCENKDCPNSCTSSTQGLCDTTSGVCGCFDGYFGIDCSYKRCKNDCNIHGICDKSTGTCSCYDGFFGTNCESIDCPRDCGSAGGCDYSTGLCKCKDGFTGNDCMYTTCPSGCTSATQGTCNYETGVCTCNDGYAGVSCSYTA